MSADGTLSSWDELIGQTIGPDERYEVRRRVGQGGMGVVFEAFETAKSRAIAIKFLNPEGGIDQEVLARFQREGKRFSRLRHPGIVSIYGMGRARGLLFIASEFVYGKNLFELVKQDGPFAIERAIDVIAQVAEALKVLHDNEVVHRDLKPENIMVEDDGARAKILDFGIAKDLNASLALTRQGAYIGTTGYSAPEQIRGEPIDGRADIFSLGVIFYEIVTGEVPFKGRDTREILENTIKLDPISASKIKDSVSAPVARLIAKMISKKPKHRPKDCMEVIAELGEVRRALADPLAYDEAQGLIGFLKRLFKGGDE
jgi:eukaryotic-like serine/threonine-protein kinase